MSFAPIEPSLPLIDAPLARSRASYPASISAIRNWPASERPRERLRKHGASALSDSELLALFIRTGIPGSSAVDIGRNLLLRFRSLSALLDANDETLSEIIGLGPAKIAQLRAIKEIVRRSLVVHISKTPALDSPNAVGDYLQLMVGGRPYEVFVTLYLDIRFRLLHAEESSRGTLTQTAVYPREIIREAMRHNAAAVIVAHNHPSGDVAPSDADRSLTRQLKTALQTVDIRLIDHFVVSSTQRTSFSERGWL